MTSEADRLRELLAISRAITSTSDYEETLRLVVGKACAFARSDACLLLLADPGGPASIAASFGLAPAAVRDAHVVLDERLNSTLREELSLGAEAEIAAFPMIVGGRVRGSLVLVRWHPTPDESWCDDDDKLISALVDQASITIGHMTYLRDLRLAEAQASGILAISADAIISVDENHRITLFNDGAERIFGYSRSEAIGAPLEILIPERFRAAHPRAMKAFASGAKSTRRMGERDTALFGLRKGGEEFVAQAAISKLEVGNKIVLTVALRDITEQTRIESEQRFLAEVGRVLSATLDYDETVTKIAELAVQEIGDLCVIEVVEGDDDIRRLKVASRDPSKAQLCEALRSVPLDRRKPHLLREVLETGRPVLMRCLSEEQLASHAQSEEHRRILRAATIRSMMGVPLVAPGRLVGAIGFASSTPSRLYGPADLRLAEKLAERAAMAIENARLYRVARQATQSRDDVLGVVAHDLRNPLSCILLQAKLLGRRGGEPERRSLKPALVIERAATRMNHLIQDLLDVTHMEAGQLALVRASVCAQDVVTECIEAQRPLATPASLELTLDIASDLPQVSADRDRLFQILENLIGNAIKFTPAGGRITVGARPQDDMVLFSVTDTGCGVAPEALPFLFDRFWQARRTERSGVGLGLPIVKGLIEAHHGRIRVESTPGQGTTFFFTIPMALPLEARPPPPRRAAPTRSPSPAARASRPRRSPAR